MLQSKYTGTRRTHYEYHSDAPLECLENTCHVNGIIPRRKLHCTLESVVLAMIRIRW